MTTTINKLVKVETDLYERLDITLGHSNVDKQHINFVMRNRWTLFSILSQYDKDVKEANKVSENTELQSRR